MPPAPPAFHRDHVLVTRPPRVTFDWGTPSAFARRVPASLVTLVVALAGCAMIGAAASFGAAAAIGAFLAVAGAVAVLLRPALAGLALVSLVPLLSGVQRGLPVPGAKISEIIVAGGAGLVLLTCAKPRGRGLRAVDLTLFVYVLATALLGLHGLQSSGDALTVDAATTLLAPVQFLLIFRAVHLSLSTPDLRRLAVRCVLYASTPMSVVALVQQFAGSAVNPVLLQVTGSARVFEGNSTGLFAGKHDLAGYMLVIILLSVALLLTPDQRVMSRAGLRIVLVLAALSLVCTVALAAVGGAVLGVGFIAYRRRCVLRVFGAAVAVGVVSVALFGPALLDLGVGQFTSRPVVTSGTSAPPWLPHGVAYRMAVWQDQYIPALTPHLLTGYGPTLPPGVSWQFTESAYLSLLLRGGVVLLLVFAAVNIALYVRAADSEQSRDATARALGLTVATLVVVLAVINATNPYILNAGLSHLFWMLAGLLPIGKRMRTGSALGPAGRGSTAGPPEQMRPGAGSTAVVEHPTYGMASAGSARGR
jgi:hypothetical protein